jgi:hypothetical protein
MTSPPSTPFVASRNSIVVRLPPMSPVIFLWQSRPGPSWTRTQFRRLKRSASGRPRVCARDMTSCIASSGVGGPRQTTHRLSRSNTSARTSLTTSLCPARFSAFRSFRVGPLPRPPAAAMAA